MKNTLQKNKPSTFSLGPGFHLCTYLAIASHLTLFSMLLFCMQRHKLYTICSLLQFLLYQQQEFTETALQSIKQTQVRFRSVHPSKLTELSQQTNPVVQKSVTLPLFTKMFR